MESKDDNFIDDELINVNVNIQKYINELENKATQSDEAAQAVRNTNDNTKAPQTLNNKAITENMETVGDGPTDMMEARETLNAEAIEHMETVDDEPTDPMQIGNGDSTEASKAIEDTANSVSIALPLGSANGVNEVPECSSRQKVVKKRKRRFLDLVPKVSLPRKSKTEGNKKIKNISRGIVIKDNPVIKTIRRKPKNKSRNIYTRKSIRKSDSSDRSSSCSSCCSCFSS